MKQCHILHEMSDERDVFQELRNHRYISLFHSPVKTALFLSSKFVISQISEQKLYFVPEEADFPQVHRVWSKFTS